MRLEEASHSPPNRTPTRRGLSIHSLSHGGSLTMLVKDRRLGRPLGETKQA